MASYNVASDSDWSVCNGGGEPNDGDVITVLPGILLTMDKNSTGEETYEVVLNEGACLDLAGYNLSSDVVKGEGAYLCVNGGTLTGAVTTIATVAADVDMGSGGEIYGSVNLGGVPTTWSGSTSPAIICETAASTLDLGTDGSGGPADASMVSVEIDSAGTVTAGAAIMCGSFTHTAGTYGASAYDHTVYGSLSLNAGTFGAQTGTWECAGTGALYLDYNNQFVSLKVSGTYTVSGSFVFVKALSGDGTIAMANHTIYFRLPSVDNWYTFTGTYTGTGSFKLYLATSRSNAAMIDLGDYAFSCVIDNAYTLTADLQCGALQLTSANGTTGKLTCGELHCAALLFGDDGENENGNLETNGVVTVDSVSVDDATAASTWNMGSSYIECGGVFDGDNLTVTDTSGTCHIMGLGTGTLQNVVTDNLILAHDFATYGANTNVGQDTHAAPGSMALCGVGY